MNIALLLLFVKPNIPDLFQSVFLIALDNKQSMTDGREYMLSIESRKKLRLIKFDVVRMHQT